MKRVFLSIILTSLTIAAHSENEVKKEVSSIASKSDYIITCDRYKDSAFCKVDETRIYYKQHWSTSEISKELKDKGWTDDAHFVEGEFLRKVEANTASAILKILSVGISPRQYASQFGCNPDQIKINKSTIEMSCKL